MKKFLATILCFIMGCVGLVGCAKEPEPTPQQTVEKSIFYYAVIDDGTEKETTSIPVGMYKKDGSYPAKYVVGTGATISDLVEYEENGFKYTFGGWFSDEALNTAFEKIDKTADSDVKVYAKVTKTTVDPEEPAPTTFSIKYCIVIDGAEASVPEGMFKDGSTYPATYVEGTGATIPDLQDYTEGYSKWEFEGWYINKDCTTAFDGTIPATQTGKVVLYAKITIEDVTPPPAQEEEGAWTKNY